MAGGFKRSKWFGLIGVFLVVALAENPTTMPEPELWAGPAMHPIGADAVRARSRMWDAGRRSRRLGMAVVVLIFLTVPPVYLLESFVPLMIGVPLIVIVAIWGSIRAVGPGGEMDAGYELVGEAMAPLGLAVAERPTVSIGMREPVTPRMGPRVQGELVLEGTCHDLRVSARLGGRASGGSEVAVACSVPAFEARHATGASGRRRGRRTRSPRSRRRYPPRRAGESSP